MKQKTQHPIMHFAMWVIGNVTWDIFKGVLSTIISAIYTWKLSNQPKFSELLISMNVSIIIALAGMFLGFAFAGWYLLTFCAWIYRRVTVSPLSKQNDASPSMQSSVGQNISRSPVAKNGGYASGGDMHITQIFPPNAPQLVSFAANGGEIIIKRSDPNTNRTGNDTNFRFVVFNETNSDLNSVVYIDEIAYLVNKRWVPLEDAWEKPLHWNERLVMPDGTFRLERGKRSSFTLLGTDSSYKYLLTFNRDVLRPLPHQDSVGHRILVRLSGSQIVGNGVSKKVYIYLDEKKKGIKQFVAIVEYKGD